MDARTRAETEKKIVIALVGVFGLTLAGSLRSMGLFGAPAAPAPVAPPAAASVVPLAGIQDTLQKFHERMSGDRALTSAPAASSAPVGAPRYAASSMRDPLKSYLPERPIEQRPTGSWQDGSSASSPVAPPPQLRLQGVLLGGPVPQAIINNKVYRVGESINGAKITVIERQGVMVEFNGVTTRYTTSGASGR